LSPKLTIVNRDAFTWIRHNKELFDLIVIDFPDPSNYSIGKLYSTKFYEELHHSLADDGIAVVQSTSPLIARKSYWCINNTLASCGFVTVPYHAYVPSFGEWGYVMGMKKPNWCNTGNLPSGLRYINQETMRNIFSFPPDMDKLSTDVNRLNNQVLVDYFEEEWGPYLH
jgi:spermidine synthase